MSARHPWAAIIAAAGGPPALQVARPISTFARGGISDNDWTASTGAPGALHLALNEPVANDDASYVTDVNRNSNDGFMVVGLEPLVDPLVDTGHVIVARVWFDRQNNNGLRAILYQGSAAITGEIAAPTTAGGTYQTLQFAVSTAGAAAITDYSSLRLGFIQRSGTVATRITQAYLQVAI